MANLVAKRKMEIAEKLQQNLAELNNYSYGYESSEKVFVSTARVRNCQTKKEITGIELLKECFEMDNICNNDDDFSILIKGNPGLGKTFLAKRLFTKLLENFMEESEENGRLFLPIYIALASVVNALENNQGQNVTLDHILKQQLCLLNLLEEDIVGEWKLLIIIDGYDECNIRMNNFGDSPILLENVRVPFSVITFSRPDPLPSKLHLREAMFGVGKLFNNCNYFEFDLIPFSFSEVKDYVRQFCVVGHSLVPKDISWDYPKYISWLKTIPDLEELSGTPLLLSLILPAMPKIVKKYSDEETDHFKIRQICSTQTGIFDEFTQQWFEYQSKRNKNTLSLSVDQFQRYCRIYSQNLATQLVDSQGFLKEGSWTLEETLDLSLLEPVRDEKLMADWASTKNIFSENSLLVKTIKDSCLLSYSNNCYHFFHRSIAEYFAAKNISEDLVWSYNAHINAEQMNISVVTKAESCQTLKMNLISSLLGPLGDRAKANREFENLLLIIVRRSAEIPGLSDLSSKALTILNAAQYNFSSQDFRDILVPFANMKGSICAKTDFRGANLQGVDFTQSYLVNTRFEGANLSDANFGEELQSALPDMYSIIKELSCYRTPSENIDLFYICSKFDKHNRKTKVTDRTDENIAQKINFDTGLVVQSFSLGKAPLLQYYINQSSLQLVTWPYYRFAKDYVFDLKLWNLSTGKLHQTISISNLFQFSTDTNFSDELAFGSRGRWIAMKTEQTVIVTSFAFHKQSTVCKQLEYPFSANVKIYSIIIAPNKDILVVFTSENIHILTLDIVDSEVILSNVDILDHSCEELHSFVNIFDSLSNFMVYGADVGPRILHLYNLSTKRVLIFKGQSEIFSSATFNHDSTLLAAGDYFSNVFIWNIANGQLIQTFSRDSKKVINICFHPDINLLACSMRDDSVIKFWKIDKSLDKSPHNSSSETLGNISHGNIGYICTSFDGRYVASLNYSSVEQDELFGENEIRELSLNIWEMDSKKSFLLKPRATTVGKFWGPGIAFSFSDCQKCIILGTILSNAEKASKISTDNHIYFKGLVPEPVALIYDVTGKLISKIIIEHDSWKGIKSLNYRSALFFDSHGISISHDKYNLATPLWDGSIQLWKFIGTNFVKTSILVAPEEILSLDLWISNSGDKSTNALILEQLQVDKSWMYKDPLNMLVFENVLMETKELWVHTVFVTFSCSGDWVISNIINKVILIWYVKDLAENPVPAFYAKVDSVSRPLAMEFVDKTNSLFWIAPHDVNVFKVNKSLSDKQSKQISRINLELINAKLYEPFNWLICGDRNGMLRIWHTSGNKLLLEIPFWFPIYALTLFKVDEKFVNIIFGGFYENLIGVRVSKSLEWDLFRVFRVKKANLSAKDCNISQSLQMTQWSRRILNGLGAQGQPADPKQKYYSFHQLFRELPGTASSIPVPSALNTKSVQAREISADNNIWVVSLVAKTPKTKLHKGLKVFGIQHLFIVLEGFINLRKFAIRADLRQEPNTGNVIYVLTAYESFSKFSQDMKNCEGRQWEISPHYGRKLIRNIRRDQQLVWKYDFLLHNCISWSKEHLIRVGVPLTSHQGLSRNTTLNNLLPIKLSRFMLITLSVILLSYLFSFLEN